MFGNEDDMTQCAVWSMGTSRKQLNRAGHKRQIWVWGYGVTGVDELLTPSEG